MTQLGVQSHAPVKLHVSKTLFTTGSSAKQGKASPDKTVRRSERGRLPQRRMGTTGLDRDGPAKGHDSPHIPEVEHQQTAAQRKGESSRLDVDLETPSDSEGEKLTFSEMEEISTENETEDNVEQIPLDVTPRICKYINLKLSRATVQTSRMDELLELEDWLCKLLSIDQVDALFDSANLWVAVDKAFTKKPSSSVIAQGDTTSATAADNTNAEPCHLPSDDAKKGEEKAKEIRQGKRKVVDEEEVATRKRSLRSSTLTEEEVKIETDLQKLRERVKVFRDIPYETAKQCFEELRKTDNEFLRASQKLKDWFGEELRGQHIWPALERLQTKGKVPKVPSYLTMAYWKYFFPGANLKDTVGFTSTKFRQYKEALKKGELD